MLFRYDTDGAIIIRDLVDSGTISEMRQAIIKRARKNSPAAKSGEAFWEYLHGNNTIRFTN